MYEKKIIFIVISFICAIVCSSCRSTKINDTDIISGNSYAIGQLEATIKELDRTTTDSRNRIEAIIGASRNIENGIERVEYLFREYEFEVERLCNEIDTIRNEIEKQSKNHNDFICNSGGNVSD